jgi:hypothetical protein
MQKLVAKKFIDSWDARNRTPFDNTVSAQLGEKIDARVREVPRNSRHLGRGRKTNVMSMRYWLLRPIRPISFQSRSVVLRLSSIGSCRFDCSLKDAFICGFDHLLGQCVIHSSDCSLKGARSHSHNASLIQQMSLTQKNPDVRRAIFRNLEFGETFRNRMFSGIAGIFRNNSLVLE